MDPSVFVAFRTELQPYTDRFAVIMTGVMKRWIACLVPWMVLAGTAFGAKLDPVNVQFSYNRPATSDAFRVGDQCYITPKLARNWEWNISLIGDEMQVATEGRLFRVPVLKDGGQTLLSLTDSARFLGAVAEWDGGTYRVLGRIRNIELTDQGLQVDSTIKVKPNLFRLSAPDRLVVDFIGAKIDVGDGLSMPSWWRVAQYDSLTARVVFEHPAAIAVYTAKFAETRRFQLDLPKAAFQNPANITEPIVAAKPAQTEPGTPTITLTAPSISPDANGGTTLTIGADQSLTQPPSIQYLTPTQMQLSMPSARFAQAYSKQFDDERWVTAVSTLGDGQAVLLIQTKRAMAFSVSTSGSKILVKLSVPPSSGRLAGKVVVIDAGHGGRDTGASFGSVREKDLTLRIAQSLRDDLVAAGASVIMTRDSDVYPSLGDRAQLANRSNAAIFVSIHINSINKDDSRSGSITFFHNQDPMDRLLAECIQSEIAKVNKIPDLGTWSDTRIYQSGFKVLRDSNVPSVLIEMGFINHKYDRAQMTSPDFSGRVGAAIVKGIQVFLGDK